MNILDLIAVAGFIAVGYGLWLIHPSAMWIGLGSAAVSLSVMQHLKKGRK